MKFLRKISHRAAKGVSVAFFALLLLGATWGAFMVTAPVANAATISIVLPAPVTAKVKKVVISYTVCKGSGRIRFAVP